MVRAVVLMPCLGALPMRLAKRTLMIRLLRRWPMDDARRWDMVGGLSRPRASASTSLYSADVILEASVWILRRYRQSLYV